MKTPITKLFLASITIFACFIISCTTKTQPPESIMPQVAKASMEETKQLRHVVLFKFQKDADPAAIKKVEEAFVALPGKIPEIRDFEWGLNNSHEGHDKGFTHCYFLTFNSEEDRATYLPHPDHKAFGSLLGDVLEDVTVVDYWAK